MNLGFGKKKKKKKTAESSSTPAKQKSTRSQPSSSLITSNQNNIATSIPPTSTQQTQHEPNSVTTKAVWQTSNDIPTLPDGARTHHAVAALPDGSVVVAGGVMNDTQLNTVWFWNPSEQGEATWTQGPSLQEKRVSLALAVCKNKLYAIGGYNGKTFLNTVECLGAISRHGITPNAVELASMNWTTLPCQLSNGVSRCAAATVFDRYIVVLGGWNGQFSLCSVDILDTKNNTVQSLQSRLTTSRADLGAAVVGSTLYAVGGTEYSAGLDTIECWDVFKKPMVDAHSELVLDTSAEWREVTTMSLLTGRSSFGLAQFGRFMVVMGGWGYNIGCLKSAEVIDTKAGKVWKLPEMGEAREHCAAVSLRDGRVAVLGGKHFSPSDSVETIQLSRPANAQQAPKQESQVAAVTKQIAERKPKPLKKSTSNTVSPAIESSRSKLKEVILMVKKDPAELSVDYIRLCTSDSTPKRSSQPSGFSESHRLGEGAFGSVYKGSDSVLGCQFAVKKVNMGVRDKEALEEITLSFRREIATLKRFCHPNIVALYGYNVRLGASEQFLVYEFAVNGSLDNVLRDDKERTKLDASRRLYIMYQIARAIHFLHTGGCNGFKVFHRDIKSGNICLMQDFTAKLIDCGMAKFVADTPQAAKESVTPSVLKSSGAAAFGTPGYICPKYAQGNMPFEASCDIYSLGVVMVELVLGCLQGGQSSRNNQSFGDFFTCFIRDEDDELVDDGWRKLTSEADPVVEWELPVLERICKLAVGIKKDPCCMAFAPRRRISSGDLVKHLGEALSCDISPESQPPKYPASNTTKSCSVCNRSLPGMCCTCGHFLCIQCFEGIVIQKICRPGGSVSCSIAGCSSRPFTNKELHQVLSPETFELFVREQAKQELFDKYFATVNTKLQKQQDMLQSIEVGVGRSLRALALLTSGEQRKCPNLVWLVPASVQSKNVRDWAKGAVKKKYQLFFICQHSFAAVQPPLELDVPRVWLSQVAPVLKICLFMLKTVASMYALPFPFDLPISSQLQMNEEFVSSLVESSTDQLLKQCEDSFSGAPVLPDSKGVASLVGPAYDLISEKANKPKRSQWKELMTPVLDRNGSTIWVKNEFVAKYQ